MVVDFTCLTPFRLLQFYFLFSNRKFAGTEGRNVGGNVAPQILIVLFLIYLFDNIIQLISFKEFMVLWIVVIR
jgi:hypothetical protein